MIKLSSCDGCYYQVNDAPYDMCSGCRRNIWGLLFWRRDRYQEIIKFHHDKPPKKGELDFRLCNDCKIRETFWPPTGDCMADPNCPFNKPDRKRKKRRRK